MGIKDSLETNWRKVKEGWTMFAYDAEGTTKRFKEEWKEGDYARALFHTLSAYKSAILRFPYRTWAYTWELKWLGVAYVWAMVPAPDFLVRLFTWSF